MAMDGPAFAFASPFPQLPDGPFLLFDRPGEAPDEREELLLNEPEALLVFTDEDKAEAYHALRLSPEWEMFEMQRGDLLTWLEESYKLGIHRVAIDPSPEGEPQTVSIAALLIEAA